MIKNLLWPAIWIGWVLLGVVLEFIALRSKAKGDTLSENIWSMFNHSTYGKFATYMLSAFLIWLVIHFATKGKYA